jgi:hypothetical protein
MMIAASKDQCHGIVSLVVLLRMGKSQSVSLELYMLLIQFEPLFIRAFLLPAFLIKTPTLPLFD